MTVYWSSSTHVLPLFLVAAVIGHAFTLNPPVGGHHYGRRQQRDATDPREDEETEPPIDTQTALSRD